MRCALILLLAACGPASPDVLVKTPSPEAPVPVNGDPSPIAAADAQAVADLAKHANQILAAFGNRAPRLSRDGRTVVFSSNRDGTWQLYAADSLAPRNEARAITKQPDGVTHFELLHTTPEQVVYAVARAGSPGASFFVTTLDGQSVKEVTPGPALDRGAPFAVDKPAGAFVYTARDSTHAETQLQQLAAGGEPRVLYTDPSECTLVDVEPAGTHALLIRGKKSGEQELVLVDLIRGEASTLYRPGGAGQIPTARFAGPQRVLVSTDANTAANLVLLLESPSGKELWRHADSVRTGLVRDISISPDHALAALRVAAGARDLIRFVPLPVGKKPPKPRLPDATLTPGDGTLGAFTPDGSRVLVRWALPDEPSALFSVPVGGGPPSVLHADSRPVLAKLPPLTAVDLEIPAFDGKRIPVNLYLPKDGTEKKPILVMLHGGPADVSTIGYSPLIRFYTAFGFGVVEPNVRGSSGFGTDYERADDGPKRLDALRDLQSVGEWIKSQPWADPARLALWGGSYGGYFALLGLSRQPSLWRAGVDLAGPTSWRTFFDGLSGETRDEFARELGSPDKDGAFLDSIAPDPTKIAQPLFVFQGQNDTRVPRAAADQLVTSLRARSVPVEYFVAPDEAHGVQKRENQALVLARSTLFLRKHLEMK